MHLLFSFDGKSITIDAQFFSHFQFSRVFFFLSKMLKETRNRKRCLIGLRRERIATQRVIIYVLYAKNDHGSGVVVLFFLSSLSFKVHLTVCESVKGRGKRDRKALFSHGPNLLIFFSRASCFPLFLSFSFFSPLSFSPFSPFLFLSQNHPHT